MPSKCKSALSIFVPRNNALPWKDSWYEVSFPYSFKNSNES